MNPLQLVALAAEYGPTLYAIWKQATSNANYIAMVEQLLPQVANVAEQIAQQFFPQAAPQVHKVVVTAVALNHRLVRYDQQAIKLLNIDPKIVVDGWWGPVTEADTKKLQTQFGLTADGILGKITEAAIQKALPALAL